MSGTSSPSTATAAGRAAVAALLGAGVQHVVLCPGSRSAPLAYALHAAADAGLLHLHVRHDERVAGFTALGAGRLGAPAAVVTTSGTAVANLAPAVLEAHEGGVPLVVLTADRPHAMRGTWANQTTAAQAGLFAGTTRSAADVPAGAPPDDVARAVAAAVRAAAPPSSSQHVAAHRPGPVHVDLAFADPLVPDDAWAPAARFVPTPSLLGRDLDEERDRIWLQRGPRTVVVAGDGATWQARWLAEAGGWPLLAEPSSGARSGPNAVRPYRLLLEHEALGGLVERVVVLGRPTLSRPVTRLMQRADVELVVVSGVDGWPDPGRPARRAPHAAPAALRGLQEQVFLRADADAWLTAWLTAGAAAAAAVDAVLDGWGAPTGPAVAREVAARSDLLVVAASNPVRDVDLAGPAPDLPWPEVLAADPAGHLLDWPLVIANRGLAGIDGTVSTATGVALASGRRTRALVGDVALLHDAGALLLGPAEQRPDLQVVVPDDGGGGIFAVLEHGEPQRAATFERLFGTPHGADLAALCAGYRVPHRRAESLDELREALATPAGGLEVVQVPVDRGRLRELHAGIRAEVRDAVRGAGVGT